MWSSRTQKNLSMSWRSPATACKGHSDQAPLPVADSVQFMTFSNTRRLMFRFAPALVGMLLVTAIAGALALTQATASAADVNHGSLATETPRRDTPIVLDGTVWASVQLEDRVIVAGDFSQVQTTRGGPVVARSNIFAYDINSGDIIDDFAPNVSGIVRELVVDETNDNVFLGGSFTQVDGEWRVRVAKLDYFGNLDPVFRPDVDAQVLTMALRNDNELYLGGSFTQVNGESAERLGAIDTITGASLPTFNFGIEGDLGKEETRSVKGLALSPNGNRLLVIFNGRSIVDNNRNASFERYGVAFISLTSNAVTGYTTDWYKNAHERCSASSLQLRDVDLSPDGLTFAVVEKGGLNCDKIVAFPAGNNNAGNDPLWVTAAHDSVFSVEVTNNAVYAGGHFCYVRAYGPVSSDDAPTIDWLGKPANCDIAGGNNDIGEFTARQQIVALDPTNGEPLDWNPRSNALEAVFDITAIDRGLLIGQDADRINDILTGRQAFLDFGGTTPPYQPIAPASCTATVDQNLEVSLNWDEVAGVAGYAVRRNNGWITSTPATSFSESPAVGTYEYVIRYRINNVVTDIPCNPTIEVSAPSFSCTATANGDDVTVSWNDQPGVNDYQVRRDGSWLAASTGTSYIDQNLAAGNYSYEIRYRSNGTVNTVACSPATVAVDGPPTATLTCSATGGNLSWNAIAGVSTYQVRKNNSWLASTGARTYSDAGGTNADDYQIRYRQGGQTITVDCN